MSSSSIPAETEVPATAWAWPCSLRPRLHVSVRRARNTLARNTLRALRRRASGAAPLAAILRLVRVAYALKLGVVADLHSFAFDDEVGAVVASVTPGREAAMRVLRHFLALRSLDPVQKYNASSTPTDNSG